MEGFLGLPVRYIMWVLIFHLFLPIKTKIWVYSLYNFVQQDRSPVKLWNVTYNVDGSLLEQIVDAFGDGHCPLVLVVWEEGNGESSLFRRDGQQGVCQLPAHRTDELSVIRVERLLPGHPVALLECITVGLAAAIVHVVAAALDVDSAFDTLGHRHQRHLLVEGGSQHPLQFLVLFAWTNRNSEWMKSLQ